MSRFYDGQPDLPEAGRPQNETARPEPRRLVEDDKN